MEMLQSWLPRWIAHLRLAEEVRSADIPLEYWLVVDGEFVVCA